MECVAHLHGGEHRVGRAFPSCHFPCEPYYVKDIYYNIFFVTEWYCVRDASGADVYEMAGYSHPYGYGERSALYCIGKTEWGAPEYAIKRRGLWYRCRRELGVGEYYIVMSESEL